MQCIDSLVENIIEQINVGNFKDTTTASRIIDCVMCQNRGLSQNVLNQFYSLQLYISGHIFICRTNSFGLLILSDDSASSAMMTLRNWFTNIRGLCTHGFC